MLDFYYAPGTVSLAAHIALLDAGLPFRPIRLDIRKGEHKAGAYAQINPKLRVPTLVTPHGPLTETPAILEYAAETAPEADLVPSDPFARAQLREFMSYLASTLHVAHAHKHRGHRWVDPDNSAAMEAMRAKVPQSVTEAFSFVEETYALAPFVFGARYSLADPYLFTVARWLDTDGVAPGAVPRVEAHREMMSKRGTVCAALKEQSA